MIRVRLDFSEAEFFSEDFRKAYERVKDINPNELTPAYQWIIKVLGDCDSWIVESDRYISGTRESTALCTDMVVISTLAEIILKLHEINGEHRIKEKSTLEDLLESITKVTLAIDARNKGKEFKL